jgi:hypothetical protein
MKFKLFAVFVLALSSLSAFALTSDNCCTPGAKCCGPCCGASCCQHGASCCPGDCCQKT